MKKLFLVGLGLTLLAGACGGTDATQPRAFEAAKGCATSEYALETLELTVAEPTGPLARGSVAELDVQVVRHVDVDADLAKDLPPANNMAVGDPTEDPVEGAVVALSLSMADADPLYGMALTDAQGRATIAIKVKRSTPAGTFDGSGYAWREVFEGPCVRIVEAGSYHQEAAATVE